jgi:hypothetical protein
MKCLYFLLQQILLLRSRIRRIRPFAILQPRQLIATSSATVDNDPSILSQACHYIRS